MGFILNTGRTLGLVALLMLSAATAVAADADAQENAQKAVLVTGASSGIGRHVTELLASQGYFVYAGARSQQDLDALDALENVEAVRLDVTVQDEIDAAVETVRKGGRGLYGLVNNAGVFTGGPLIETDIGELQWLFDVNVYGAYRVTQAFAPLIIEAQGRIINISSISGVLDWPMGGLYTMSKHAIEAYNDTLALELARFGVNVSAIEPGNFKSDITQSAFARIAKSGVQRPDTRYTDEWAGFTDRPEDRSEYKEPEEVAAAVLHALFDSNPKPRYLVVPNQEEAQWTIGEAIKELIELNERHPYSYSREQLIEMIDAAMAVSSAPREG
jgi:NAD(P)-dependent dehydrogenase (short-subunit alcohol dehydrogenase family)